MISFEEILDESGLVDCKGLEWFIEDDKEREEAKQINNFIKTGDKNKDKDDFVIYRW